jgi:hypothetical protein
MGRSKERVSLVDLAGWEHEARDRKGRWTKNPIREAADLVESATSSSSEKFTSKSPVPWAQSADDIFRSAIPADKMPKGWKLVTPKTMGLDFVPDETITGLYDYQRKEGMTAVLAKGPHGHVIAIDPAVVDAVKDHPEWTPAFLAKASQALEIAQPALGNKPVLVHMDLNFYRPGMPEGVLAYVNNGDGDMLTVNPYLLDPSWGKPENKAPGEWFPMAFEDYPLATATMVHEMGHIVDNRNGDTTKGAPAWSPNSPGNAANFFWRSQYPMADKAGGDEYGHSNPFEGYAECFAQYMLTKATMAKSHHATLPLSGMAAIQQKRAEAFAQEYGWDRGTK